MCVYIFGRFTFKILGHALLLWFIVCFFTMKCCYLLLSLFISITIVFTIISIIAATIIKYIVITFQFFNTLITYILTIYWLKVWFPFFHFHFFFFLNSMLSFFVNFSNFVLCHFSFPIAFQLSQLTATTGGEFK